MLSSHLNIIGCNYVFLMSQVFEPKEKTLIANTYIYEIGIKTNLLYLFLFDFLLVEKGFSIHPIQYLLNKKKILQKFVPKF